MKYRVHVSCLARPFQHTLTSAVAYRLYGRQGGGMIWTVWPHARVHCIAWPQTWPQTIPRIPFQPNYILPPNICPNLYLLSNRHFDPHYVVIFWEYNAWLSRFHELIKSDLICIRLLNPKHNHNGRGAQATHKSKKDCTLVYSRTGLQYGELTANFEGRFQLEQDGLLKEDLARLQAEPPNLGFGHLYRLPGAGAANCVKKRKRN